MTQQKLIFKLSFLTAGLNGDNGLIREHYSKAKKMKDKLKLIFLSQKPKGMRVIDEPVRIIYKRYTSVYMDWDNAAASFKHIGDALQDALIILDDNPNIVKEFIPQQIKVPRKEARTEIEIEFLN